MPRGSAKGEHRGGRKPGTPNRDQKALQELLEEKFPSYHPILQMAGIAQDESVDIKIRLLCHKEVAQYLYPKRKAVEHTSGDGGVQIVISEATAKLA